LWADPVVGVGGGTGLAGDVMLGISGKPYDTLEEVIGLRGPRGDNNDHNTDPTRRPLDGSLREWGVGYEQVGAKGGP
jgi:cystathionine beta-lyase family protein involved in aluminum resistance